MRVWVVWCGCCVRVEGGVWVQGCGMGGGCGKCVGGGCVYGGGSGVGVWCGW